MIKFPYFIDEFDSTPNARNFENGLTEYVLKTGESVLVDSNKAKELVEDGKIVKDQLLHIKSIEIDEIDIGGLVYEGVYKPAYPEPWATQQTEAGNKPPKTLKNVTLMGHNGTWTFTFESPFYMWLLENLY